MPLDTERICEEKHTHTHTPAAIRSADDVRISVNPINGFCGQKSIATNAAERLTRYAKHHKLKLAQLDRAVDERFRSTVGELRNAATTSQTLGHPGATS